MGEMVSGQRVALVTGGGTGIGKFIALKLADHGIHVAIMGRTRDPLESVAQHINERNSRSLVIQGDVTNSADVQRAVDVIRERWGRLDILVNNAGVYEREAGGFLQTRREDIDDLINVNLRGVILMSQASIPLMLEGDSGSIVNISSTAGAFSSGGPMQPVYGAAKAAVIHFTASLARIVGPKIRVNVISPGGTADEEMTEENLQKYADYGKDIALGRIGFAEDVARTVNYLVSDESSYVTGNHIILHGGGMVHRG